MVNEGSLVLLVTVIMSIFKSSKMAAGVKEKLLYTGEMKGLPS